MELLFFLFSFFTITFTILSVVQNNAVYALFYFFSSVITTSVIFFLFGSYFIGSFQIIVYAGSVLVLFVFVMMMFDSNKLIEKIDFRKIFSIFWVYPVFLFFFLILLMVEILLYFRTEYIYLKKFDLKSLGLSLFGSNILITEFVSVLLLSALIIVFLVSKHQRFLKLSIIEINHQDL